MDLTSPIYLTTDRLHPKRKRLSTESYRRPNSRASCPQRTLTHLFSSDTSSRIHTPSVVSSSSAPFRFRRVYPPPVSPTAAPYNIMVRDGRVHDIDKDDLDRWCEYIFYRGLYRTAYARISRGSITDTELQVGQFAVPRYGKTTGEVSEADRYLRARREELPKEHVRTSPGLTVVPWLPVPC